MSQKLKEHKRRRLATLIGAGLVTLFLIFGIVWASNDLTVFSTDVGIKWAWQHYVVNITFIILALISIVLIIVDGVYWGADENGPTQNQ